MCNNNYSICVLKQRRSGGDVLSKMKAGNGRKKLNLHSIFLSEERITYDALPCVVKRNIDSFKRVHPQNEYFFWQEDEIRDLIKNNFDPEVLQAFDCLKAFAIKADLARYCILYVMGGVYSDLSNYFIGPMVVPPRAEIVAFKDRMPMHGACWMVQNTIIYASPKASELISLIELCVHNIKKRNYGNSSLEPTGPAAFGRILAMSENRKKYSLGKSIDFNLGQGKNRSHYIASDGSLVALRLQGGGGKPSEIGLKKTNIYGEMWDKNCLFDENSLVYFYDSPQIIGKNGKGNDGIDIQKGTKGFAVYGPYVSLYRGEYTAILDFTNVGKNKKVKIDVCGLSGRKQIKKLTNVRLDKEGKARLTFRLDEYIPDLEVRLNVRGDFEGRFKKLSIIREGSSEEKEASPPAKKSASLSYVSDQKFFIHDICINAAGKRSTSSLRMEKFFKEVYPSSSYETWNKGDIGFFIKENFSDDVYSAYCNLENSSFGEDLARYCLLYIKGGLAISGSFQAIFPLSISSEKDIFAFSKQSDGYEENIFLDRSFLFSQRRQPEFALLIEWLVEIAKFSKEKIASLQMGDIQDRMLCQSMGIHGRTSKYVIGQTFKLSETSDVAFRTYLSDVGTVMSIKCSPLEKKEKKTFLQRVRNEILKF